MKSFVAPTDEGEYAWNRPSAQGDSGWKLRLGRSEFRAGSSGSSLLSTVLWQIRQSLPEDVELLHDSLTVQFDPQAEIELDAETFEAGAKTGDQENLEQAVALYQGDLLAGFNAGGAGTVRVMTGGAARR
jgi:hypothetical protein